MRPPVRLSALFFRTLRDDPVGADVASDRLLLRAGFVRRVAPGIFTWLPLGLAVRRNIERIAREEMDRAGFQEVQFPALLPRAPYEASGRWQEYGDNLFRLQDRRGDDYLLGPTHEEMFTLAVKDLCTSYRDLPRSIYQIQTKYRDEIRPRAGLLRGREFTMLDSYSFDNDPPGLVASYQAHRAAWIRIFDRLELPYVIVAATSGAMGGSASEEFLAPLDVGEDTFARCAGCGYAANIEAVRTPAPTAADGPGDLPPAVVVDTPGTPTIQTLVDLLNSRADLRRPDRPWVAGDTLKNVLVMLTGPDGAREPLAIGLPGDRELDVARLAAQVEPAQVIAFGDADFAARPELAKGYIGPGALGESREVRGGPGIRYLVDPRVVAGTAWVTGSDSPGRHVVGLVAGRDFTADGTIDAAEVRDGDPCPECGAGLRLQRGIEIGHIFQLGTKYATALGLEVAGPDGHPQVVTMGSYGFGVSRAVAAIAEATSDDKGLCWPRSVSPADVHLVTAGKDPAVAAAGDALAAALAEAGVRVLYDDRPGVSAGVKFKDAELIGVATIVIIGKGLADGVIEVKDRRSGVVERVPAAAIEGYLVELLRETPPRR